MLSLHRKNRKLSQRQQNSLAIWAQCFANIREGWGEGRKGVFHSLHIHNLQNQCLLVSRVFKNWMNLHSASQMVWWALAASRCACWVILWPRGIAALRMWGSVEETQQEENGTGDYLGLSTSLESHDHACSARISKLLVWSLDSSIIRPVSLTKAIPNTLPQIRTTGWAVDAKQGSMEKNGQETSKPSVCPCSWASFLPPLPPNFHLHGLNAGAEERTHLLPRNLQERAAYLLLRVQNQRPRPSEALLGNVTCDLRSRKEPLRLEGPDVPPRLLAVSLPMQVCTSAENLLYRETFLVFSERNISSAVVKHTLVGDPNVSANIFSGCRCMCLQTPWAANLQGCFGNTCLGREIAMLSSAARMSRRKCLCVLLYSVWQCRHDISCASVPVLALSLANEWSPSQHVRPEYLSFPIWTQTWVD